jgi:hypothetical protein
MEWTYLKILMVRKGNEDESKTRDRKIERGK